MPAAAGRACLTVYAGPPRGGCYARLQLLMEGLATRGWMVHYVGVVPPPFSHPALVYHPVRPVGGGQPSLGTLLRCAWRAFRVCVAEGVRAVWTFGAAYTLLLAPLRLLPGRRLVTFLRGSLVERERARGRGALILALAGGVERFAAWASDRLVVVSADLAARAGAAGRAVVLRNDVRFPAESPSLREARESTGLPPDVFLAGCVGAVHPVKSLETLLEAVALLDGSHLLLMGFGADGQAKAYEDSIRRTIAELGLARRVQTRDWSDDTARALAALDAFVLPSLHEGCPNALLEAMARGIPCLGARSPGVEEVLEDPQLLFPPRDARALAARLAAWRDDPAERARAGLRARERAAAYVFDWEGRAAELLEAVPRPLS